MYLKRKRKPTRKYSIIYIDPPWHYNSQKQFGGDQRDTNGAASYYKTIKTEDLKQWDIPSICREDCLLFMWTSSPHLDQAIELGKAWLFNYATVGFVWFKGVPNPGSYTMSECEICLIFKKGMIPQPRGARNVRQFLSERRTTHSTKPIEVLDRITKMFPQQVKLEMFARKEFITSKDDGWEHWGDEVESVKRVALEHLNVFVEE